MRQPHEPVVAPFIQEKVNAYYKSRGVETEIVEDEKGFQLAIYVNGKHIGGLDKLANWLNDSAH